MAVWAKGHVGRFRGRKGLLFLKNKMDSLVQLDLSPERKKRFMKGVWTCRQKSDYAGFCRSWQGPFIMCFEDGLVAEEI